MYPHRMRLHGPWQFEPLARTVVQRDGRIERVSGSLPEPGRMKIPATWRGTALDGFRGRVRWSRNFHSPRSLEPNERLWLVFQGVDYFTDASLNGMSLGRHEGYFEAFEFDVTSLVGPRNELVVEVDCPAEADLAHRRLIRGTLDRQDAGFVGGIWREVALEVRSVAFLLDVAAQAALHAPGGTVTVTGRVVGVPGISLALDLSVEQTWLAGQKIQASPDGTEFRLEAKLDRVECWWPRNLGEPKTYSFRLELHGLARTLDMVEQRVGFRQLAFDPAIAVAELNGRKLPVIQAMFEGGNDLLAVAEDAFVKLFQKVSARQNCLVLARVLGRVVAPQLYALADSQGILLWQDFPLCGGYSSGCDFQANAVRQATAMIHQLGHHPSVALWCCHLSAMEHDAALDEAVRSKLERLDPSRPCLLRSDAADSV